MSTLAFIGNIFSGDGLIVFMTLLLVFGCNRLPDLAKGLGLPVWDLSKTKDKIFSSDGLIALMILMNVVILLFIFGFKR